MINLKTAKALGLTIPPSLLLRAGRGWQATFYVTGMEHSLTKATGSGSGPTP